MSKLIVCLGYNLLSDNSISPILENRLKDALKMCMENGDPTLLLMGGSSYHGSAEYTVSQARAMKEFLEQNFSEKIKDIKVEIEEVTSSTVEQLCYLKEFIKLRRFSPADVVIISSEFFNERVKLYTEYVLGTIEGIVFFGSVVPGEAKEKFKFTETEKLEQAQNWLKDHEKGDDKTILEEQRIFQAQVIRGEIYRKLS